MNGITAFRVLAAGAACAWALGLSSATAQTADPAAVKARLAAVARSYTPDNGFMGTVLVAEGDTTLLSQGYGKANLDWGIDNAPDVKFRLGSLTKQFTAALVLLLQEDGKLSIADPVSKYLTDAPRAWAKITLTDLLRQTSGIPNFTEDKAFGVWSMSAHTPAEELAFFSARPLEFEPGAKFEYSNSNYEVLGAVIEKVSGKTYAEMLRTRILQPLGLNDTGLDTDEGVLPRRAAGYKLNKGALEYARSESMTVPWAAGSMYSTTGDLLAWERALFGGKLLSAASLKAMTTAGKGDYAMGLVVAAGDGPTLIWHNGGIEGFNTYLGYQPDRGITVVVLGNLESSAPDAMGDQLIDVVLGRPVLLDSERKAAPISVAELARFEGNYQITPAFTIRFARDGDILTVQGTGPARPLLYEGVKAGHPTFYLAMRRMEMEFVPAPDGVMKTVILRQGRGVQTGERR